MYIEPSAAFGRSGVESSTSPILEASGHLTGLLVKSPIWAGVQLCRPSAKEGEKLMPSGRVTVVLLTGGVARALGFSFWAILMWTSRPVGVLASLPVGSISTSGSKRGRSQSVVCSGSGL